jgi:dipeptidyl aminopeptidase/acylaminoacyl peptidase
MLKKIKYLFFIAFISAAINISAEENVLTSYSLFNLQSVAETSVSPDGNFAAYIVIVPRPLTDNPGVDYRHLYVINLLNGASRGLVTEKGSVSAIHWSPDSKEIYFKSRLGESTTQVHRISADGGSPKKVTSHVKSVEKFKINHSGTSLAFTSTENHGSKKEDLLIKGFDAEIYEEEYLDLNLYITDLQKNITNKLTSNVSVFDFYWSPDDKQIAAAIADRNLVDDSYMFKRIFLVDPVNGSKSKLVDNPGKLGNMAWSPDGKHLAFISAVDINDPEDGCIFIAEVPNTKKFSELRNYSEGFKGSVFEITWKDEHTFLFAAEEGVDIVLSEQNINENERKIIIEPGRVVFKSFNFHNGIAAFPGHTPSHPAEVYTFDLEKNELKKWTNLNPWLQDVRLAKQEKITYYARDGLDIQAILIYPLNYEPGKKYPLIVYVHGGPESSEQNGWVTSYSKWGQIAAAKDYFVIMPNYRPSSGRGVEFSKMNFGDLAAAEFDDVIDGVDFLIEKGYVDKNKVGIGGGSYGGYFAAWGATKHTERFAASVVFVGVSNQLSKRNTTDIPYEDYYVHWGIWSHEDPELVYDRSPVKYAHQSKTPTLVLHGKEDPRVHPSQGLELYRSLKLHSKAPVRLVWYPGEKHGNTKNTAKYDYSLRTMEWFDYYLKSNKPKDKMPNKYLDIEIQGNI